MDPTLSAFGPQPVAITGNVVARGWYRVLKGRTSGVGPAIVTSPFEMVCTRYSPYMSCEAARLVNFGPGVTPVINYSGNATGIPSINAYINTPSVLFDWDGDGVITAEKEGLMLMRFALGFRGAAITRGIALAAGITPTIIESKIAQGAWNGWFSFRGNSAAPNAPSMTDALLFERCARGLRGAALTASLTSVASVTVNAQCDQLMRIE